MDYYYIPFQVLNTIKIPPFNALNLAQNNDQCIFVICVAKYMFITFKQFLPVVFRRLPFIDSSFIDYGAKCWIYLGKRNNRDRKSTRLNSSHVKISYAVICLK